MAGRDGVLLTGHAVGGSTDGGVAGRGVGTRSTVVRMGRPTRRGAGRLHRHRRTAAVAGALTIDGFGGWFVDGVDGDPSNVLGISLPLTRRAAVAEVGVAVTDLWRSP